MKSVSLLTHIAVIAVLSTALGLAVNFLALGLFATAASALITLVIAADYSPRPKYALAIGSPSACVRSRERMPLAA